MLISRFIQMKKNTPDKIVRSVQEPAPLTKEIKAGIQDLTNYLLNRSANLQREISSYNWLLEYENADRLEPVIRAMEEVIQNNSTPGDCCVLSETELLEKLPSFSVWAGEYSAIFIISEENTSPERWNSMLPVLDTIPEVLKILCASKKVTDEVLRKNEHLYYRVFAKHLSINALDVDDIITFFMAKLERNYYRTTEKFDEDIRTYISVVYPKAQLREADFINDLYRRVNTEYQQSGKRDSLLDESYVPFYRKPEEKAESEIERTEAEPSRIFCDTDQEEENVLFLSISSISYPQMNKYQDENETDRFRCVGISQLEPGTKKVLWDLAQEGKKLNRIVMVESKMSRTKDVPGVVKEFWDDPDYMEDKYKSAVCFYKQRIRDYLRRNTGKEILAENGLMMLVDETAFERRFPENICYDQRELDSLFYDVPTYTALEADGEQTASYIEDSLELFLEIIHGIKGDSGKPVNLYIDTQGGARNAALQLNAVLELLKDQNVTIRGRCAIPNFNNKVVNTIRDVEGSYKSSRLVSAMTEFKLYGRGAGLAEFFEEETDSTTRDIVKLINEISGAIALCNINLFEKALEDMKDLSKKIQSNRISANSQIRLVFQDMIDDYSELLQDGRSPFDVVEWCVKKRYYQQAVTIIESKMPDMLAKSGFFVWKTDDPLKNIQRPAWQSAKRNDKYPYDEELTVEDLFQKWKKEDWKPEANFLFEQWIYANKSRPRNKSDLPKYFGETAELDGEWKAQWEKRCRSFRSFHPLQCNLKEWSGSYWFEYKKFAQPVGELDEKSRCQFLTFAALSSRLKDARNGMAHANSNLTDTQIKDALETYIELGKELKLSERRRQRK